LEEINNIFALECDRMFSIAAGEKSGKIGIAIAPILTVAK
jgi:hypothetical protein